MKTKITMCCLGAASLALMLGCSQSGYPQPGEIVVPKLSRSINWTAGKNGGVWATLTAQNQSGEVRRLSFAASPMVNPVATVVFYGAEGSLVGEDEVELTERC